MNRTYVPPEDEMRGEIYRRILLLMKKNRGSWQSVAAAVGLFGGMFSIVLGALDWAAVGLFAPAGALGSLMDAAGIVCFALPLPLLVLGACCLDLLEEKSPAIPLAFSSQPDAPRPALRARLRVRRGAHTLNFILILFGASLPLILPATAHARQPLLGVRDLALSFG